LAAGFLDDFSEQVGGVAGEVSAGGDHRNDGIGEVRIKGSEASQSPPFQRFQSMASTLADWPEPRWMAAVRATG
jgi:hypothetical protein